MAERKYDKISAIAKRRGIFWPSSEIHGGIAGFFDYGPIGALLKRNIEDRWKELFVVKEGMFFIETPTLMPEPVFKASGHLDHFKDFMAVCKKCGNTEKVDEIEVSKKGESNIKCSKCKADIELKNFNLMFRSEAGAGKKTDPVYLRPETAQGMFVAFSRLKRVARKQLPFGVCQIGKAYRNEISPRQGMIRLREFTQAEAEIFCNPSEKKHPNFNEIKKEKFAFLPVKFQEKNKESEIITVEEVFKKGWMTNEYLAYYLVLSGKFFLDIGIPKEAIRCRQHLKDEKAHYSKDTWDIEIYSEDFGWVEVAAIANRTDFDLGSHAKASGENLEVQVEDKKILPHVIEASFGVDRPFYSVLEHSFTEEEKRTYFAFNKKVVPYEVAVFPLISKKKLPEKAKEVYSYLAENGITAQYDDSGSIGRRYARADEIGIPACITIDFDTLDDNSVTVRERDSTKQVRVKIKEKEELLNTIKTYSK